jgi:hypothetical protein
MSSSKTTALKASTFLLLALAATTTPAASLSYILDQSSSMPDDTGYLQVTISDGLAGAVDFLVTMLQPLSDAAGDRFGIQKFSFNVAPGASAEAVNVSGLPDGWRAMNGGSISDFGRFDIALKGNGSHRVEELSFSITGIDADALVDYVSLSTGHAADGHSLFAARVYGVNVADSGRRVSVGGISAASVVPAPAAIWLLGSAIGLLMPFRRRSAAPRAN